MATDRRFKLLGQGLPGNASFKVSELSDGEIITWDAAAGKWVNGAPASGVTDHGALTGLADDDHTQYLLATGARALSGTLSMSHATAPTIDATVDSAILTLSGRSSASATTVMASFNPNGAIGFRHNGVLALETRGDGIRVLDTLGNDPLIRFYDDAETILSRIQHTSNNIYLWNETNSGHSVLRGKDAGGTTRDLVVADPDFGVDLRDSSGADIIQVGDSKATMNKFLSLGAPTILTIAAGIVTATRSYHAIDTESAAATDDLDQINSADATSGTILVIRGTFSSRDVTVKDGTGNLRLAGDFTFTSSTDTLVLIRQSTLWYELSRSDNA